MTDLERVTAERDRLRAALAEAEGWTAQDLKAFDDIAPNEAMLRARLKVIRTALADTAAPAPSDADRLRAALELISGGASSDDGGQWAARIADNVLANTTAPDPVREAAPELLAALEYIVNDSPVAGDDAVLSAEGYNRACAAIAKAERRA